MFIFQWFWYVAKKYAFITSSRVFSMLLTQWTHAENQCLGALLWLSSPVRILVYRLCSQIHRWPWILLSRFCSYCPDMKGGQKWGFLYGFSLGAWVLFLVHSGHLNVHLEDKCGLGWNGNPELDQTHGLCEHTRWILESERGENSRIGSFEGWVFYQSLSSCFGVMWGRCSKGAGGGGSARLGIPGHARPRDRPCFPEHCSPHRWTFSGYFL